MDEFAIWKFKKCNRFWTKIFRPRFPGAILYSKPWNKVAEFGGFMLQIGGGFALNSTA